MHVINTPTRTPATTAQLAAFEFAAAEAVARMPKEARQRLVREVSTAVYTAAQIAIEIVAESKCELIETGRANYETLGPGLMQLAKVRETGKELLDIIADAECRLAVALAVVEGDDDPPDGNDGEPVPDVDAA